mgnify:CR=1 FL=1
MTNEYRLSILAKIKSNIASEGYHLCFVDGGPLPRFAYTIGLYPKHSFELVFGGGTLYNLADVKQIFNEIVETLELNPTTDLFSTSTFGSFRLNRMDISWASKIILGAIDYYDEEAIRSFQIFPDEEHWTIDVPDMQASLSVVDQPIWQWLVKDWDFNFSPKSVAITNLDALKGYCVTEVMRWTEIEWELYSGAGPEVAKEDIRKVPLATLIEFDQTLGLAAELEIGCGVYRDDVGSEWSVWRKKEEKTNGKIELSEEIKGVRPEWHCWRKSKGSGLFESEWVDYSAGRFNPSGEFTCQDHPEPMKLAACTMLLIAGICAQKYSTRRRISMPLKGFCTRVCKFTRFNFSATNLCPITIISSCARWWMER